MFLTNKDFKAIEKALELLPQGEAFKNLDKESQDIIVNASVTMVSLLKKKEKNNKRTAEYIAEKRKVNKNYARSRREVRK